MLQCNTGICCRKSQSCEPRRARGASPCRTRSPTFSRKCHAGTTPVRATCPLWPRGTRSVPDQITSTIPKGSRDSSVVEWCTCEQKVSGSSPGRSGRRIFSSTVNFLCWLILVLFHPICCFGVDPCFDKNPWLKVTALYWGKSTGWNCSVNLPFTSDNE